MPNQGEEEQMGQSFLVEPCLGLSDSMQHQSLHLDDHRNEFQFDPPLGTIWMGGDDIDPIFFLEPEIEEAQRFKHDPAGFLTASQEVLGWATGKGGGFLIADLMDFHSPYREADIIWVSYPHV